MSYCLVILKGSISQGLFFPKNLYFQRNQWQPLASYYQKRTNYDHFFFIVLGALLVTNLLLLQFSCNDAEHDLPEEE